MTAPQTDLPDSLLNQRFFDACDAEDAAIAESLAPGADPWWKPSEDSQTALWFAVFGSRADILEAMLANPQFQEAVRDPRSDDLLWCAIPNGSPRALSLLLPFFIGGRLDAIQPGSPQGPSPKETALMFAAKNNPPLVGLLLESGADPLRTDAQGRDSLMAVAGSWWRGAVQTQAISALLACSDLARVDQQGRNALMLAAETGSLEAVQALKPFFDAGALDHQGVDAFSMALREKNWPCVDFLGCDVSPRLLAEALDVAGAAQLPRSAAFLEAGSLRAAAFEGPAGESDFLRDISIAKRFPRSL